MKKVIFIIALLFVFISCSDVKVKDYSSTGVVGKWYQKDVYPVEVKTSSDVATKDVTQVIKDKSIDNGKLFGDFRAGGVCYLYSEANDYYSRYYYTVEEDLLTIDLEEGEKLLMLITKGEDKSLKVIIDETSLYQKWLSVISKESLGVKVERVKIQYIFDVKK